jgi:exodeoxyribonuclease-3
VRVVSWNVNSIRSRGARVASWLRHHEPDVALLQETKCDDATFAAPEFTGTYEALGYEVAHHGRDHRDGVAILSRVGLERIERGFPGINRPPFDDPRLISARCGGIDMSSIYVPNGRTLDDQHYLFKLVWLERLRSIAQPDGPILLAGDFNVAPTDLDIYDPKRWRGKTHASPPERAALRALLDVGLVDVTRQHLPEPDVFTWWSYRPGQFERNRGLRIDLALCSSDLAHRVEGVWIDSPERVDDHPVEKPSDHAPLVVDLTTAA